MIVDGYEVLEENGLLVIKELPGEQTKSWRSMLSFSERFPKGTEPEWDAFIVKHTAMQSREIGAAILRYRCELYPEFSRLWKERDK